MMTIDTTNMCSHLQKKLFEPDGVYYPIWQAMKDDESLTVNGFRNLVGCHATVTLHHYIYYGFFYSHFTSFVSLSMP